MPHANKQSFSS